MKPRILPAYPVGVGVADPCDNSDVKPPSTAPLSPSADKDRRARRKRRPKVDPTTCDRPYTHNDIDFMIAMDHYKRDNRRPFPTWSEVLEVLHSMGYRKVAEPSPMPGLSADMAPKVEA